MNQKEALIKLGLVHDDTTVSPSMAAAILGLTYLETLKLFKKKSKTSIAKESVLRELALPRDNKYTPVKSGDTSYFQSIAWIEQNFSAEYLPDEAAYMRIATYLHNLLHRTGKDTACHLITGQRIVSATSNVIVGKNLTASCSKELRLQIPVSMTGFDTFHCIVSRQAYYKPVDLKTLHHWPYHKSSATTHKMFALAKKNDDYKRHSIPHTLFIKKWDS